MIVRCMSDTYALYLSCSNCGKNVRYLIPKGTSSVSYRKTAKCFNCDVSLA